MSAGEAGSHVVAFLDFFLDVFLEVQHKRYSQILYLIDHVVPGLHFWYKNYISREMEQNLNKSRFTNKYPDSQVLARHEQDTNKHWQGTNNHWQDL